ncbi:MAG: hypothetical protein ABL891_19400 [Burkholderiales bacterium]
MSVSDSDREFTEAMVSLSLWRSKNPGKELKDEPEDISLKRKLVMLRLSEFREGGDDPWMGRKINTLIRKSTRYIVYLDDKLDIQWWWTERLSREDSLSLVQANVTRLSCASDFLLSPDNDMRLGVIRRSRIWGWIRDFFFDPLPGNKSLLEFKQNEAWEKAKGIRSLIAESMAMVLNGVGHTECEKVQAMAEYQILIEKDHICRGYFFSQFAIALTVCIGVLGVAIFFSESLRIGTDYAQSLQSIAQAVVAGVFGAFVSAMARTRELALEPQSGRQGLRTEAFARAAIGAGAAILAYFAFESQIVLKGALSNAADVRDAARYFLCMAAGASERILPALIGRAETLIDGTKSSKEPKRI